MQRKERMSYIKHNEKGNFYSSKKLKQDFEISAFLTPVPRVQFFYNREEEIIRISKFLFEEESQFLSITGLAGIGKSSLIKKSISDFQKKLNHIIWLRYFELNDKPNIFYNETLIANLFLNIEDIQIDDSFQIIERMNELKGKNLLVIDDFDAPNEKDLHILKQLSKDWKIILISRYSIKGVDELILENLNYEDYKTIIKERLDSIAIDAKEFDRLVDKANDLLGLTPLSVSMLIRLANKPELTFKDVVDNILTSWEGNQKIPHKSIGEIIDNSFNNLSDLDKKFVSHFVILPQKGYSKDELVEFFEHFDIQDVLSDFDNCMKNLLKISLINYESDELRFHPLIKEYIVQKFKPFLKLRFSKDVIIFFSTVKTLISKDSVNQALREMIEFFEDDKEIHNEVIILSGKWKNVEKSRRLGILHNSDISVIENQIRFGLLSLIDKREEEIKETLHAT